PGSSARSTRSSSSRVAVHGSRGDERTGRDRTPAAPGLGLCRRMTGGLGCDRTGASPPLGRIPEVISAWKVAKVTSGAHRNSTQPDAQPKRRKTMSQRVFMTALVAVVAACLGVLAGGGKSPGAGAGLAHAEQRKEPAEKKKEAAAQWEYG